jgi:hypothetical protein
MLDSTVKEKFGSNNDLAEYLGISRGTARAYRVRLLSLPMRFLKKLQILNPSLRAVKITDASWDRGKARILCGIHTLIAPSLMLDEYVIPKGRENTSVELSP